MKQSVAIMDFGTSKITVMIGSRGINNSVSLDGMGICEYAGFIGGEWIAPEKLASAISRVIATAESNARLKINKIYVGVPADFLLCKVNDVTMSLGRKRRIFDSDVEALHNQGNDYFDDPEWKVINIQPIYYTLDDDRKLIAPVGLASTRMGGSISYIMARRSFIKTIDAAIAEASIGETEYVSSPLAETLFLFDDYSRDNYTLLADVGALGTTLSLGRGDGIARQYYFPWGGERITAALSEKLGIPYNVAAKLKRIVNLSLDTEYTPPEGESGIMQTEYILESNGEKLAPFDVAKVNAVVEDELSIFARYVDKALKQCDYPFPDFTALSVTGGGLMIRGATEYVSSLIDRETQLVKPKLPMFEQPRLSSALALMDMVLTAETAYLGIGGRLRRWLSRRHSK